MPGEEKETVAWKRAASPSGGPSRDAYQHRGAVGLADGLRPGLTALQRPGRSRSRSGRTEPDASRLPRRAGPAQSSVLAAVSDACAETGGQGPPRSSGSARSVICPQAVPPTKIAPITANASRHAGEGMPSCAKPSVA